MKTISNILFALCFTAHAQENPVVYKTTEYFPNANITVESETYTTTPYITIYTKLIDGVIHITYGVEEKHEGKINIAKIDEILNQAQKHYKPTFLNKLNHKALVQELLEVESENLKNTTTQLVETKIKSGQTTTIKYENLEVGTIITPKYDFDKNQIVLHITHNQIKESKNPKDPNSPEVIKILIKTNI